MELLGFLLAFNSVLCVISLIITIPIIAISKTRKTLDKRINKLAVISGSITAVMAISLFSLDSLQKSLVRDEVKEIIAKISFTADAKVNGRTVHAGRLLKELENIRWAGGHNSHPMESYNVQIKGNGTVFEIWLRRDSKRKNEFWVFYPKYYNTRLNSFARLKTTYFNKFMKR